MLLLQLHYTWKTGFTILVLLSCLACWALSHSGGTPELCCLICLHPSSLHPCACGDFMSKQYCCRIKRTAAKGLFADTFCRQRLLNYSINHSWCTCTAQNAQGETEKDPGWSCYLILPVSMLNREPASGPSANPSSNCI